MAAGIAYSRTVVTPIRRITELFKRSGSGELALPHVEVRGGDEIAELGRWFNTFLDTVNERSRSEAALRESEERYALAVRGANDALWDWDLRTDRLYLSPRFAEMLGLPSDAVGTLPDEWFGRIPAADRPFLHDLLDLHLRGGSAHFEAEHRILGAGGEELWMLARGLAVRDAAGEAYRMVGSLSDITARKRAEQRLRHEATHDALTGLSNRRALFDAASNILARATKGARAGLLLFDIDHFKDINDTLGHAHGDRLLGAVGSVIRGALEPEDQIARLGGDEFAILRREAGEAAMAETAERVIAVLREPLMVDGELFGITISVGIALSDGAESAEDLVRKADLALYEAKRTGRNRAAFFDEALEEEVRERVAVETALRLGSPAECVAVEFQPQVEPHRAPIRRYEALARWRTGGTGPPIPPSSFIPAAERIGLIHEVTRAVVRHVLAALAAFDAAARRDVTIAVNLSAIDLGRADFADEMMQLFDEAGVAPHRMELEITESVLLLSTRTVIDNIERLGAAGCRFALDDFGTGFSSLAYLRQFPIQTIKIDRAFIEAIGEGGELVGAMISLGHAMDKLVVAEGVETAEQAATLAAKRCDLLQGFYIARPLPLEEAVALTRFEAVQKAG
jgi:diguanylate cyclase (GGDEF)-like protein/PAS domain S-box-containing protein